MGQACCGTTEDPTAARRDLPAGQKQPIMGVLMDTQKANVVVGVRPGGPAERIGLREGDKITEIRGDGWKQSITGTKDMQDIQDKLAAKLDQPDRRVKIIRQNKTGDVDVLDCSVRDASAFSSDTLKYYSKGHSPRASKGPGSPPRQARSKGS
eukprot:TRINITY_DN70494_c0_g1_i1.p2 TRINITY_DN70494_c0_g1~~TRINITY_DN70494_c0_g1_i1.p2  ORF type:complete len:153 (+),score=48.28 TRINITY_DN70494_c0_g1_i1:88-546(+)